MKNLLLATAFGLVVSVSAQPQSPFVTPPGAPATPPTPANPPAASAPGNTGTGVASPANPPLTNPSGGFADTTATTPNQPNTVTPPATHGSPLFLNLSGTMLTDASGQPVGTIQQIVLSPAGAINFAVLSMNGRLVPVPWQLISAGTAPGRSGLTINSDRSLLQNAPAVAMNQLPLLTQEATMQQLQAYYAQALANKSTLRSTPTEDGSAPASSTTAATAQGRPGNAGVTITGGNTNTVATTTNIFTPTNAAAGLTVTNQATNTTGGLLSPTGATNVARDPYNPNPGTLPPTGRDPRPNSTPTTRPNPVRQP